MATRQTLKKPDSRYRHGDLRGALVVTAWSVIERKGIEALSLRAVADALGVSHAAAAYHFRDKEELLDELRVQAWSRFADALEAGGQGGTLPPDMPQGAAATSLHAYSLDVLLAGIGGPHRQRRS